MATNALSRSDLDRPSESFVNGPAGEILQPRNVSVMAAPERRTGCEAKSPAVNQAHARRRMCRKMTREQGCAIEMLGHAIDYLNDSNFYEGADEDILDMHGSSMEALRILIVAQQGLLQSIPLTEPFTSRLLNRLRGRDRKSDAAPVVP